MSAARRLGFGAAAALALAAVCAVALPGPASVKAQEPAAAPPPNTVAGSAALPAALPAAGPSPGPTSVPAPSAPAAAPAAPASTLTAPDAARGEAGAEAPTPVAGGAPAAPAPVKPPSEPLKRPRFDAAILQGVDKITAETLRFEVKVGEPVRYKGLILTVHACEGAAADETETDSVAHLEVQSQPEVLPGRVAASPRLVFRGWMFASSPTLHPFEHPVYDLWLIACKTAAPSA